MRTTIDIPEDLVRRTKAAAALRGMKFKDLVAKLIDTGLTSSALDAETRIGFDTPIPVWIPATGRKIPVMTNAEIFEMLDREDDEAHGRLP